MPDSPDHTERRIVVRPTQVEDIDLARESVGVFFALPVVVAMGLGALMGGAAADRLGHGRAVAFLTAGLALDVIALAFVLMIIGGQHHHVLLSLLAVMYVLYGAFAASSCAMFMDISDPSLGATQFSTFMGATNFCEVWATYAVGSAVVRSGYGAAFVLFAVVSLLSIPLIPRTRRNIDP